MKDISVIIPVYNCEKTIKRCIESIIAQTYKNYEIILVNDGSSDDSKKIIEKYIENYNNIKLINQENSGPSVARNRGIDVAKCEYIFFLDSDDFLEKDTFNNLINSIENDILVGVNFNIISEKECIRNVVKAKELTCNEMIQNIITDKNLGVIWGYLLKKEIINDLRFDENTFYMEDTIFLMHYLNKIKKIKWITSDNSNYNYFINENSITTNSKNVIKKIESFCYSLNAIDNMYNMQYHKLLSKRKLKLIEKECRKLNSQEEYNQILNNLDIKKCCNENFNIFSFVYRCNSAKLLNFYYKVRSCLKKMLGRK